MQRLYSRDQYMRRIEWMKQSNRDIAISTDIIVGFPGETEEDFQATLDLLDQVEYDSVFSFKYSKRPNTPALQFEDHIPEEEKSRRLQMVQERQRAIQIRLNAKYVGEVNEAHVEGFNKATGQWIGRTSQNKTLNFHDSGRASESLLGKYLQVRVTRAGANSLIGESVVRAVNLKKETAAPMEVEMKIRGLTMDPVTQMPIVVLKDVNGNTVLPIWVGIFEANAIALEIEKVSTPRPMTHDLLKTVLMGLETGVRKVVVSDLKDDTFYALIWLERGGELISIDSRPSDALALALRLDCPIYRGRHRPEDIQADQHRQRESPKRRVAKVAGRS